MGRFMPPTEQEIVRARQKVHGRFAPPTPEEIVKAREGIRADVLKAAGAGTAAGITLGFGDELSSIVERGIAESPSSRRISGRSGFMPGMVDVQPSETALATRAKSFSELAKESRQIGEKAEGKAPFVALGGRIVGGGLASTLIPGSPLVKAVSLGGLTGLGESEKESVGQALTDVGTGVVLGTTFGLAAKGLSAAPALAKKAATSLGRRAIGFIKSTVKRAGGPKKVDKAVQLLLEKGVIRGGLARIADNVATLRAETGQLIGSVLDQLDNANVGRVFNPKEFANRLRNTKVDPGIDLTLDEMMQQPVFSALAKQYQAIIETADNLVQSGTFKAAQKLKGVLRSLAFKEGHDIPGRELAKKAYLVVRDTIDEAIENTPDDVLDKVAKAAGAKNVVTDFLNAKKAYQAAKVAEVGLDDAIKQATGNRILSLTDLMFMANVGAARGGPMGVAVTLGKRVLESTPVKAFGARTFSAAERAARPIAKPISGAMAPLVPGVAGMVINKKPFGGKQ